MRNIEKIQHWRAQIFVEIYT